MSSTYGIEDETKLPSGPYQVSRDDFLKYIELDLWSRFQERLWKLVGIFTTAVAIAGILGIPYYINTAINSRLAQTEADFARKRDEVLEHGKLLGLLTATYEHKRFELVRETSFLISKIEEYESKKLDEKEKSDPFSDWNRLKESLVAITTKDEYSTFFDKHFPRFNLAVKDEMAKLELVPSRMITKEVSSATGATAGSFSHPIYNGTLGGALKDLRFRIQSLEAFRLAMEDFRGRFISLGANSVMENRAKTANIEALYEESIDKAYVNNLEQLKGKLLDEKEGTEFSTYKELYGIRGLVK